MAVLVFSILAVILHVVGCFLDSKDYGTLLYLRNQLFGMAVLLACVQILDFLSFHQLFGPWAIIIGDLMKDLARFLAVLVIFMVGFSLVMAGLNSPIHARKEPPPNAGNQDDQNHPAKTLTNGLPSGGASRFTEIFFKVFFFLLNHSFPKFQLKSLQSTPLRFYSSPSSAFIRRTILKLKHKDNPTGL